VTQMDANFPISFVESPERRLKKEKGKGKRGKGEILRPLRHLKLRLNTYAYTYHDINLHYSMPVYRDQDQFDLMPKVAIPSEERRGYSCSVSMYLDNLAQTSNFMSHDITESNLANHDYTQPAD
jgi:hypothetical protein